VGLGLVERENRQDWSEELAFGRSHAYCVDESNIGQTMSVLSPTQGILIRTSVPLSTRNSSMVNSQFILVGLGALKTCATTKTSTTFGGESSTHLQSDLSTKSKISADGDSIGAGEPQIVA
jgi:hypothetical protein